MNVFFNLGYRRLVCSLFCILFALSICADDVIVLRNGDIINGTVVEVETDVVKYKKASNPNGPIYSVKKETVLSIKYANGEIDKFESPSTPTNNSDNSTGQSYNTNGQPVKAKPASDNEEMKNRYSETPRLITKQSDKFVTDFFPIMTFTEASIISTEEVSIFMNPEVVQFFDGGWKAKLGYTIVIINKTDVPIYIDRARSFRKYLDGSAVSYFDGKQYSVTSGNSSGVGVGIGLGGLGIGVGGTSSSSSTESFSTDRILAIGPHAKANLVDYKYIRLSEKKAKFQLVSDIDYFRFNINLKKWIKQGEVKTFDENDTPYTRPFYITYSTDPDFKNSYSLEFALYAKYVVGEKLKPWRYSGLNPTDKVVKEIQEVVPDFWNNSLHVIGLPGECQK